MFGSSRRPFRKFWNKPRRDGENKRTKEVKTHEINACYGYHGFQLYFSDDEEKVETILKNAGAFENHIRRNFPRFSFPRIKTDRAFPLDLHQLTSDENFLSEWINFKEEIVENTEFSLACLGLAMHQIIYMDEIKDGISGDKILTTLPMIHCRVVNNEPVIKIKKLRVSCYGKLVSVRGTVIKASGVKLKCTQMAFLCGVCSGTQVVEQEDGVFTPPVSCQSKGCSARSNFQPQLSSPYTKTVNYQTIKLQDLVGEDLQDQGRVPRTVECGLTEDLVRRCGAGDDVTITGIVKVHKECEVSRKTKQPSVFLLYIEAVSIIDEKSSNAMHSGVHFNQKDYYTIQKIHSEPSLFRFLTHSLCPKIYGHEIVKAGLLLVLFGGTKKDALIRTDCHLLMVGDPGLGKSQLLQACSNVAPRGVYVCGNTSTSSGLTVTLTKESGSDYSLEAGALMLADQGCCCIDEFDKMSGQHACLREVMEQQSISISKANITCRLTTRPSVIAAANPIGGHYNKAKTVAENLKVDSPLLSRFDIVFILLDQPNEQSDLLLSEHILALHSGRKKRGSSSASTSEIQSSSTQYVGMTLRDRLKLNTDETIETLPHVLFRKYIAYAQKYVHPVLNTDAKKVLQQFYLELRRNYHKEDSTPVTLRQMDSLIRLTQARAKLELREEATGEDAIDVVEIMRHSLADVFTDKIGKLDFTRSQNGCGVSNKKQMVTFLKALQRKAEAISRTTFTINELKGLSEQLGVSKNINEIIDSLNIQGYIIKKGDQNYQLTI